jgi:hypothetical protein
MPFYRVVPETFALEKVFLLGDGTGRALRGHPVTEAHRDAFAELIETPMSFRELSKKLKSLGGAGSVDQLVLHAFEDDFLRGYDKQGHHVRIHGGLRFGGVGAGDDLS